MRKLSCQRSQSSFCFSGKITTSAGVWTRPDVSPTQMNRFPGSSGDQLTHMTSPSFQDNLTPGADVIVQNQEDDVYQNTFSGRSNSSGGGVAAGVSAATPVTPKSFFFLTQRDTGSSVFRAGSTETQILSAGQHKEVGKDEAIKWRHFYQIHRPDRTPALCFIRAPRNHVQVLHC